jgi:PAS domain S-box-containing protein
MAKKLDRDKIIDSLKESSEFLDTALEAGEFGIWELDLRTGKARSSRRLAQIFGYSEPLLEWTYEKLLEHILPEDREKADNEIRSAKTDRAVIDFECRIRREDGEVRWIRIRGKPRLNDRNEVVLVAGVVEDITDRKVTEQELRKGRQLLESLVDNAALPIFFKDKDARYTFVNNRFVQDLKVPRDTLLGKTAADLWPSDLAGQISAIDSRVLETGKPIETEEKLRIEGRDRWFITSRFPIRDASEQIIGVGGMLIDITDRKEAAKQISRSQEHFRIMADSSPLMIWVTDTHGKIRFGNRAYLEFFGTTMEKATGSNWLRFVHPEDMDRYVSTFQKAIEERKPFHAQARLRRADGEWRWIESFGNPFFSASGEFLGYVGSSPDVTERNRAEEELRRHRDHLDELVKERTRELEESSRKLEEEVVERRKAEEAIRKSEEKYRQVVDNANEGIIITQDAKFQYVNPKFSEMIGYSPEELVSRPIIETIHPDDREMILDRHRKRIEGLPLPESYSFRAVTRNGETIWLEISAIRILLYGRPAVLSFLTDVTERVKIEEEKKRVESQLAQAQKIEALGTFAGGIAHDLNNILYPIIINIESLIADSVPGTEFHETLQQVLNAAYRQRDLVKQILSFSRRREQTRIPISLAPLLKETLKLLRSSLPSSIEVVSHVDGRSDVVEGDPIQIQQIITNLFRNAADSLAEQKGTIEVDLANTRLESFEKGHGLKPGEYAVLTVRDTGRGMSPDVIDHIFEPFFTTKEVGKGIGMGLPVAHGIVKNLGGAITVESKPGKGSTFSVYLPLYEEKAREKTAPRESVQRKAKFLLVDDEQFILSSMKRVLERLGYEVTAVQDGKGALEEFEKAPQDFNLVITDLTMPGMEGRDLVRRLKSIRSDIPVILSTGYGDTVDVQEMKLLGIDELLMKPADTRELKAAIGRVIGGP